MSNTPADSAPRPESLPLLSDDPALAARLAAASAATSGDPASAAQAFFTLAPGAPAPGAMLAGPVLVAATAAEPSLPARIAALRAHHASARLVAVSDDDDCDHVVACLRAGAEDFLSLRDADRLPDRLARILRGLRSPRPSRFMDARFKALADSAPSLVWITDAVGRFLHFNRPWLDFTGRLLEEETGQGWLNHLLPEDRARFLKDFATHLRRREPFRLDFRLRRHDGLYRWVTCQGIPHEEDGVFAGCIGSCLDISDQHEAETLLAYRAITQAALAGFGRFALAQHTLPQIKQEATRLLCDTLHLDFAEILLFEPRQSDQLVASSTSGLPAGFQHAPMNGREARETGYAHLRLDEDAAIFPGRENHLTLGVRSAVATTLSDGGGVIGFLTGLSSETRAFGREALDFIQALGTIISTVYQRSLAELALQESEHKLLQSQKMEAVGQLAGGVAHDFNNLLTAVRCYGDMLHEDLAEVAPELRSKTSEILKAAARASSLTRQLLAFSRKQVLQPETLDMSAVVSGLRDLVRSLLSENVSLDVDLIDGDACFNADRNQIEQVVLNLCLNARDAMPHNGALVLRVRNVDTDSGLPPEVPPGRYVRLTVQDNGAGMDPEVQARLFTPFFTTKPVGRGTGLGLATCAVIVKNFAGFITFESERGRGTSFHIFMPRIDPPDTDLFFADEEQVVTGVERILVVEDDEAIRQITQAILDSLGYAVTVVPGSDEALRLYEDHPPPVFDLLLTDVIMPEMDGLELARHIQIHHQPGLRTLFMSGYLGNTETVQAVADYNLPFLEKPFTLDTLSAKVRDTLDNPPAALPPMD